MKSLFSTILVLFHWGHTWEYDLLEKDVDLDPFAIELSICKSKTSINQISTMTQPPCTLCQQTEGVGSNPSSGYVFLDNMIYSFSK